MASLSSSTCHIAFTVWIRKRRASAAAADVEPLVELNQKASIRDQG
jgi:hypothetical protein